MIKNFKKKILFIYLTRVVGILSGFLSMVVVIPLLTSEPSIYGIYTICISLNLFFSYADLGFLSGGQKYAAEYFAQRDLKKEMQVIGFVLFLLALMVAVFMTLLLGLSYKPELLIKSNSLNDLYVASNLIFILAVSSPVIMLQRFNSLVYSIRFEDYIFQIIDVAFNLLKILSIQLFISNSSYNIIGYYLTIQILTLVSALIGTLIAFRKYKYPFVYFLNTLSFNREMYRKTKSIAFSSLLLTLAWILYFELDAIILGKFYGLEVVATYAIGFSFLSLARNLYNTIFSPFLSRFNHIVGVSDYEGLFDNFSQLIRFTFPICIIPPIVIIFYMKIIVMAWVGVEYFSSVLIAQLFVLTAAIGALGIPINYLMIAKEQNKALRRNAIILPLIYFTTFILLNAFIAEQSLAVAKMITIVCSVSLVFYYSINIIGFKVRRLYYDVSKSMVLPLILMVFIFWLIPDVVIVRVGSVQNYIAICGRLIGACLLPLLVYYVSQAQFRQLLFVNYRKLRNMD